MNRPIMVSVAATLLALLGTASASAQALRDPKALRWVCMMAGNSTETREDAHARLEEKLYQAAGVDAARDSEATRRQKLAALWRDPAALDGGLYCGSRDSAGKVTALVLAAQAFNDETIGFLAELGADINMRDRQSGNTVLDYVQDQADSWSRTSEQWMGPAGRHDYLGSARRSRERYARLRELGARHGWELEAAASRPARSLAQSREACLRNEPAPAPGADVDLGGKLSEKGNGPTPSAIAGAVTVSPRQAACLIRIPDGKLVVIGAMRDDDGLPGAIKLPVGTKGSFEDETQRAIDYFAVMLKPDTAVLVYCHHDTCLLSYNAVLRLAHAGLRNIYWLREGLKGWKQAGYPVVQANGWMIGE